MNELRVITVIGLIVGLLTSCGETHGTCTKVGYVRSEAIVAGYDGMKEAKHLFQQKKLRISNRIDSIETINRMIITSVDSISMMNGLGSSVEEQRVLEERFLRNTRRQEELLGQIQLEDEKIMSGVLNQVNDHLKEFSKVNGYSIIFSTMNGNSILFGCPEDDLTDKVIEFMNSKY